MEECFVRRELADNFCFYNKDYDRYEGFAPWAQRTLDKHYADKREFLYSQEQLEFAKTHDPLWNAAQLEMTTRGFVLSFFSVVRRCFCTIVSLFLQYFCMLGGHTTCRRLHESIEDVTVHFGVFFVVIWLS